MNQTNSTLADLRDSLMSHGQSVLDDLSDAATLAKDWTSAHPAISGIVGAGLILGALYGAKPSSSDRRSGCHTGNENLNNSQEVVSEGLSGDTAQQQATADWIEDWKSRAIESSIRSSLKIPKDYLPLADFNTGRSDKSVADAIAHNTKYVLSIDTDDIAKVTAAQQALIKDWSRITDQLSHLNQTSVEPEEPEEPLEDKRSHLTKLALGTARLISTHPTTLRMPTGHTAPDDMTDYVLGSDAAQGFLRNWDRWEDSILRGKQWPLGPTKSRRVMPLPWTPKMAALILLSAWK